MSKGEAHLLGLWGEQKVEDFLRAAGHRVVECRWRCRFGELDLVTEDGTYLCFVEVKLRKNARIAPARAFVTAAKQEKLRIAATIYLAEHPSDLQPRFDVAEVYAPQGVETLSPKIIYWENAF